MEKLTTLQIIDETVNWYSEDTTRRSYTVNTCYYNMSNGNHCAVGRCLLPKYQEQGIDLIGNASTISNLINEQKVNKVDDLLQEQYRGYSQSFWRDLQILHDSKGFWDCDGLTEDGHKYVAKLKEAYK